MRLQRVDPEIVLDLTLAADGSVREITGQRWSNADHGSERVVGHCHLIGSVKAVLESATRCLAAELGPRQNRVHAISPGPTSTRAASGIDRFDALIERAAARRLAGTVIPVDGGQHLLA